MTDFFFFFFGGLLLTKSKRQAEFSHSFISTVQIVFDNFLPNIFLEEAIFQCKRKTQPSLVNNFEEKSLPISTEKEPFFNNLENISETLPRYKMFDKSLF